MNPGSVGTILVLAGLALVVIGLLAMTGALDWFGRLPGDIRIERGSTRMFIPITSMILVSVVASVVIHLIRRLLG